MGRSQKQCSIGKAKAGWGVWRNATYFKSNPKMLYVCQGYTYVCWKCHAIPLLKTFHWCPFVIQSRSQSLHLRWLASPTEFALDQGTSQPPASLSSHSLFSSHWPSDHSGLLTYQARSYLRAFVLAVPYKWTTSTPESHMIAPLTAFGETVPV